MSIDTTTEASGEFEQPVPWIVQYQRAHCSGSSPLTTFQGLLSDEIVLPQSAADHGDPEQLVLATDAWVDALMNQAHFLPGEFAQEALWSFYARDYLVQVRAGGHQRYFANRGGDEIALRCAAAGLKSMLADPYLELLNLLIRLKRAKSSAARKIAADKGYRSPAAALKDLDKRCTELEANEPLTPRHKTWLKSLRKVKFAPDAEMTTHLQRVAQANPLFPRRKVEADRLRAERLRNEPSFGAVKALCDMAGLQITGLHNIGFETMRSFWPDGPGSRAYVFRADTDKGPRAALFYREGALFKRYLSVLVAPEGGLPLGSLSLTKDEYASIVPKEP
ncbi:MAG: DMP19 family protein [Caulobacteraceae bacterium]